MVNEDFDTRMNLIFKAIGAENVRKELLKVDAGLKPLSKTMKKFKLSEKGEVIAMGKMANESIELKKQEKQRLDIQKKQTKEAQRFKGEYLGLMFAGMSLQRAFGGLAKNLISTYKELGGKAVTPLSKSLTRLEANWKFLKFSIVEASGPAIRNIADTLSSWAISMAKMDPDNLSLVFKGIIGIAALGGAANILGQATIFISGIRSAAAMDYSGVQKTLTKLTGMDPEALKSGKGFLEALGRTALAGGLIMFAAKLAFDAKDAFEEGEYGDAILKALASGTYGYAGLKVLKNKKGSGALMAIGTTLNFIAEDKLFTSLGYILSPMAALLNTFIDKLQNDFSQGIFNGLISGVQLFIETLQGGPMTSKLFSKLGINFADIVGELKTDDFEKFDFETQFKKNIPEFQAQFMRWDQSLSDMKEGLDIQAKTINEELYKGGERKTDVEKSIDRTEKKLNNITRTIDNMTNRTVVDLDDFKYIESNVNPNIVD